MDVTSYLALLQNYLRMISRYDAGVDNAAHKVERRGVVCADVPARAIAGGIPNSDV